ncbi:hypothetical protein PUN28_018106 [Cardiocondyla obscurior]|uniref:Uncharacterized protein n=1 Tax=Cardiocondyla obscurior TaxID=286306 RepID=A0AAW2EII8_9HYME
MCQVPRTPYLLGSADRVRGKKKKKKRDEKSTLLMTFSLSRQRRSSFGGLRGRASLSLVGIAAGFRGQGPRGDDGLWQKAERELAAPAPLSSHRFHPRYPFRFALSFSLSPILLLSFSFDERAGFEPRVQSRKEDEGVVDEEGGWSGGVSSGRLSRSVYLSGKEARKWRSSLSLSLSLSVSLSFFLLPPFFFLSFCLSISNHFFQPSPPCDPPSLVHPFLSLHEATFRYDLLTLFTRIFIEILKMNILIYTLRNKKGFPSNATKKITRGKSKQTCLPRPFRLEYKTKTRTSRPSLADLKLCLTCTENKHTALINCAVRSQVYQKVITAKPRRSGPYL